MATTNHRPSRSETGAEKQPRLTREADAADAANPDAAAHRDQRTSRALADVDAGRLIDDAATRAWADILGTDHNLPPPEPD